jgi:hypothetical protein
MAKKKSNPFEIEQWEGEVFSVHGFTLRYYGYDVAELYKDGAPAFIEFLKWAEKTYIRRKENETTKATRK